MIVITLDDILSVLAIIIGMILAVLAVGGKGRDYK